jgi:RNA polymerase sigma-70 factor, ECF subfamily
MLQLLAPGTTLGDFFVFPGVQLTGYMARPEKPAQRTDHELIGRIAAGDEQALGEVYDRHGGMAYSLACAIVRDAADAEEVVADAFAQLWRTAGSFEVGRGSVAAWLATITRSRALDRLRSRKRGARTLERAAADDAEGLALPVSVPQEPPDQQAEQHETRTLVRKCLAGLPELQRQAIELAYFSGLSQSEVATRLDEPLGTVKTRIRTGMQKLRQVLAPLRAGGEL